MSSRCPKHGIDHGLCPYGCGAGFHTHPRESDTILWVCHSWKGATGVQEQATLCKLRISEQRAERIRELEQQVARFVGIAQKYQPAGSPPPGDELILVQWILESMHTENESLKQQLADVRRDALRQGPI